jgi:hypothetical protein
MAVFVIFLKLSDELVSADKVLTHFVVLVILALHHLKREILLAQLVVVRKIKIQPTGRDGESRHTTYHLKGSLHWDLIFIKFLLA